tara:strand:- start:5880 stop:5999 length:120 start_codon:yes stop_codon:yes gene_type:complete
VDAIRCSLNNGTVLGGVSQTMTAQIGVCLRNQRENEKRN